MAVALVVARDYFIGEIFAQLSLDHVTELLIDACLVREVTEGQIQLRLKAGDDFQDLPGPGAYSNVTLGSETYRGHIRP